MDWLHPEIFPSMNSHSLFAVDGKKLKGLVGAIWSVSFLICGPQMVHKSSAPSCHKSSCCIDPRFQGHVRNHSLMSLFCGKCLPYSPLFELCFGCRTATFFTGLTTLFVGLFVLVCVCLFVFCPVFFFDGWVLPCQTPPGGWAESHGVQVGDQLLAIGAASVDRWVAAQNGPSAAGFTLTGPQRLVVRFNTTPDDVPCFKKGQAEGNGF